jgi:hypothetical protein
MIAYLPKCADFQSVLDHGDRAILNLPLELATVNQKVEDLLSEPRKYQYDNEISHIAKRQRRTLEDAFASGRN